MKEINAVWSCIHKFVPRSSLDNEFRKQFDWSSAWPPSIRLEASEFMRSVVQRTSLDRDFTLVDSDGNNALGPTIERRFKRAITDYFFAIPEYRQRVGVEH